MEEIKKRYAQEQTKRSEDNIMHIGNDFVMQSAVDVLEFLGKRDHVILKAKGNNIPNAVATANIITENMLKGNSKVNNIILDTEHEPGIGKMVSTIEIFLTKV